MLLSACMIVKNEEWTIRHCLESLQGLVDEIIVVDTGSTDNTIDIVNSFGCKVITFAWDNDFSHARNAGIKHALGDWILVVDADEFVEPIERKLLEEFLTTTTAEGLFITVKSLMGPLSHPASTLAIRVMRLFRNRHFYSGMIHEQIADSVFRTKLPVDKFDLSLVHLGYTDEFVKKRAKTKRNTALIQQSLDDDPDNLFHATNLMAEYSIAGEHKKCAELSEQTWKRIKLLPQNDWPNYSPRIISLLTSSLWSIQERKKALKYMQEALHFFPWFTDFKKRYADMLTTNGDYIAAINVLMECRTQGDTKMGLVEFLEGAGTYFAAQSLGVIWLHVGDQLTGRKWLLQSFFENPALEMSILPLVGLLPKEQKLLTEFIEPKLYDPIASATYAEVYASWQYSDALRVIEMIESRHGESEATHRARMASLLPEGTEALYEHAQKVNYDIDWLLLGIHCLNLGDEERAKNALMRAKVRGEYLIKLMDTLSNKPDTSWGLHGVLRDFLAMRATSLLEKWLPRALDLDQYWITLKCSPVQSVLENILWKGTTVYECEQNALNAFHNHRFDEAETWLAKASQYQPTVTRFLLECDLALAKNDLQTARKAIYQGKQEFPESEMIKIASDQIHAKLDPTKLLHTLRSDQR